MPLAEGKGKSEARTLPILRKLTAKNARLSTALNPLFAAALQDQAGRVGCKGDEMEYGYPVASMAHDTNGKTWRLVQDFDPASDLWHVAPVTGGKGICVALHDAAGQIVREGALSADLPLFLDGPDGVIRLDRVEIDGTLALFVPSAPLQPGHEYLVSQPDWKTGRAASPEEVAAMPALGAGTLLATPEGDMPIDWLRPGDRILTRDNGYQPLLWLAQHIVPRRAPPHSRPITLPHSHFSAEQPVQKLVISPGCPLLLAGAELELWFAESEMFARASDLAPQAAPAPGRQAMYSLLFDAPEVVLAGGVWTGTVHVDAAYLTLLPASVRAAVAPDLLKMHRQPARAWLSQGEVDLLTHQRIALHDRLAA